MGFPGSSAGENPSACKAGDLGSIPGSERSPGEGIGFPLQYSWASLVPQMVKNLLAMRKTWVQPLGWEDSPGGGHGNPLHYSCLENPMDRGACRPPTVHGVAESDTTEQLNTANVYSLKAEKILTGRVDLGDLLGCFRAGNKMGILPNMELVGYDQETHDNSFCVCVPSRFRRV